MTRATGDHRAQDGAATSVKDGDLRNAMLVHDFMMQLGTVMRLPSKPRAPTPLVTDAIKSPPRTRWSIPVLAAGIALAAGAWRLKPAPRAELPRDVVGTWQTSDSRYAGRQLVLTDETIFQTDAGGATGTPDRITSLSVDARGDTMSVAIQHESEGQVATLHLVYVKSPEEYITLRNPAGVLWRRVTDSTATSEKPRSPGLAPPPAPPGKKAWEH